MFECTVELLSLRELNGETLYWLVAKYNFDLGVQDGDELWVHWEVHDKIYDLKTTVLNRKKEILPKNGSSRIAGENIFRLRLFVEAEDRDAVLEIRKAVENYEERTNKDCGNP